MLDERFLILISIPVYLILLVIGKRRQYSIQKQVLIFLFFSYVVGVVAVTLFPLPIQSELIQHRREAGSYISNNYIPFKTIVETIGSGSIRGTIRALGGNLVLLMPLGIFLPLFGKQFMILNKVTLLAIAISIGIESAQFTISSLLGFSYRMTNIDDVILNTLGAAVGFIIFMPLLNYIKKTFRVSVDKRI